MLGTWQAGAGVLELFPYDSKRLLAGEQSADFASMIWGIKKNPSHSHCELFREESTELYGTKWNWFLALSNLDIAFLLKTACKSVQLQIYRKSAIQLNFPGFPLHSCPCVLIMHLGNGRNIKL